MAVCDGLGSAKASHVGSYWASRIAVDAISKKLKKHEPTDDLFVGVFETVASMMTWAAQKVANRRPEEIATTLVLAVIETQSGLGLVGRVGDSDALLRVPGGWKSVFGSTGPEEGASTFAMPRDSDKLEIATVTVAQNDCVIIGTDGVCDLIGASSDVVGRRFADDLAQPCSLDHFERLVGFERRGALDDRTLVAVWGGIST